MRLTLDEWKQQEGITTETEILERLDEVFANGTAPALCSDGCKTDIDNVCPHGHPSILIAIGLV